MTCALVGCGANVAIVDRAPEMAERLLDRLEPAQGQAIIVYGDVLDPETFQQATGQILAEFGRIDCLINGAGGNNPQATTGPDLSFFDLPPEALRFVFDLNILGAILPGQVIGKHMAGQGRGVMLNISSMNAFRPLTRIPAYSAAKAGVIVFQKMILTRSRRIPMRWRVGHRDALPTDSKCLSENL